MPDELKDLILRPDRKLTLLLALIFFLVIFIAFVTDPLSRGLLIGLTITPVWIAGSLLISENEHVERAGAFIHWFALTILIFAGIMFTETMNALIMAALAIPMWQMVRGWSLWRWGLQKELPDSQ